MQRRRGQTRRLPWGGVAAALFVFLGAALLVMFQTPNFLGGGPEKAAVTAVSATTSAASTNAVTTSAEGTTTAATSTAATAASASSAATSAAATTTASASSAAATAASASSATSAAATTTASASSAATGAAATTAAGTAAEGTAATTTASASSAATSAAATTAAGTAAEGTAAVMESAKVRAQAEGLLRGMTLEEKVGQLFIGRCPAEDAAGLLREYPLGGYTLYGRDFAGKTRQEVVDRIAGLQKASRIPLLIGVDEEGGIVNRVSLNSRLRAVPFWSPQALYAKGGFALVASDTLEKCRLLRSLGINLNYAPVCDVSENQADYIYPRSFGQGPGLTADYVRTVVTLMGQERMGAVLKHFPGYGDNRDTHSGVAVDERPLERFEKADFLPFEAGIKAGAGVILVAHNMVKCMDPAYPASLSPAVHKILREKLHFEGVIMTDDLAMEGVRAFAGDKKVAVLAVQAGNDLLCCTNFTEQYPAVLEAVQSGVIPESRVDQSVLRVLALKLALGIIGG